MDISRSETKYMGTFQEKRFPEKTSGTGFTSSVARTSDSPSQRKYINMTRSETRYIYGLYNIPGEKILGRDIWNRIYLERGQNLGFTSAVAGTKIRRSQVYISRSQQHLLLNIFFKANFWEISEWQKILTILLADAKLESMKETGTGTGTGFHSLLW